MCSLQFRIKPVCLTLALACAATAISVRMFAGDAAKPEQPKQASFQVKNEFKVQVPKGARMIRMWFAVPQEDAATVVLSLINI